MISFIVYYLKYEHVSYIALQVSSQPEGSVYTRGMYTNHTLNYSVLNCHSDTPTAGFIHCTCNPVSPVSNVTSSLKAQTISNSGFV